jgi:RimJ/RimL family protein N-acetyltransferase
VSKWAFETKPELERLFALPFAANGASRRVLEKAGYGLEAVLKRGAVKEGKVVDLALYSLLRPRTPGERGEEGGRERREEEGKEREG